MKAVLISIQKEHNVNIFDGSKHFEGRKTLPAIIPLGNHIDNSTTYNPSDSDVICYVYEPKAGGGCGKVVGQFVCDFAQTFHTSFADMKRVAKALCVTEEFAKQYFNRERGYMLRVCVPERYEKLKELSEFTSPEWFRDCEKQCPDMERMRCPVGDSRKADKMCGWCRKGGKPITRPPQSWCYVEEINR